MKPILFALVLCTTTMSSYAQPANAVARTVKAIKPDTFTLFDQQRKRPIPVAVYSDGSDLNRKPVVIFSHGYGQNLGGDYLIYSYLNTMLASNGFFVLSIQHELPEDELMNTDGPPRIVRRSFWERGADNIEFVISRLKVLYPNLDFNRISLIGHSNGGDMTALYPVKYPGRVIKIITLDNRRMPLPRSHSPRVYSLRSADQPADEGVLPNEEEQKKLGITIVDLPDINHGEMDDDATEQQREKINDYILKFLVEK